MKLTKNCKYLVRVRDYETVHVEVGAEASHYDLGMTDEEMAETDILIREKSREALADLVSTEVYKLAKQELQIVNGWSEISPNLAEDFLSTPPPANVQRSHNAKKAAKGTAPSRRIRRGGDAAPASSEPRPLRPA